MAKGGEKRTGKTPSGIEWRRVRRMVDVLEHRCLWCGEWFEVKRPDLEPRTCSPSCKAMRARASRREREAAQKGK